MGSRLYVGNLPFSIRDQALEELFATFGEVVSARVIMDRQSGRSKGFGFIEMTDTESGDAALAEMNGKEIMGRPLRVDNVKSPPRSTREGTNANM
ncbi:MAG: RNA-binding protein [Bdellovibrionales bacterium]|nr:RNA-binding protein [Bdellovibrionales bacterium]MBT3527405.1 RNA-binding protein [Bdellovibrionales bacterium]MBT7669684.1 RNA-binding protein [Bdellovibrionales bacterium]MBT7765658.1 RNA-binding protein [Bdellovibrionales bacterium]